ncbi:hypothetical protein AWH62_06680 [Maricaulis sp. W15]|uniref:hypothetical protein n=1 Tax=Maricaulis sp. W15 TaxID=1772333 RepID=UPI000948EE1B|nr:hypothetical protein [Maricaulis sp. W15]OLF75496.1 hypothetical protein AWH62_06680 [Maricaulis sp. W15]
MDTATLIDRRNAGTPLRNFSVDSQAITWRDGEDGPQHSLALTDVRQVRLAVEMAGQNSQVVCRVSASDGREIAFGSMRWAGIGQWEANARDFRDFLRVLHGGLADQTGPIRYVEGASMAFLAVMTALGGGVALIGAGFFIKLFLVDENAIGLVLIPAIALGVWLMRLFWPRAAKAYDPAIYTTAPDDGNTNGGTESGADLAGNEGSVTSR